MNHRAGIRFPRPSRSAVVAAAAVLALFPAIEASKAHETDQYTLPLDRRFADLGNYLDAVHTRAIEDSVQSINAQIRTALRDRNESRRAERLAALHEPRRLVKAVYGKFNDAFTEILDIEDAVRGDWARTSFPDQVTANLTVDWIYTYTHLPIDPRRLILVWQSSTIKAHGVYFGTDKLSHFHHMGMFYYDTYRAFLREGKTNKDALAATIAQYSDAGIIGENALLGFIPTGVYSNADLVANLCGFKFYQNITEPVTLKGRVCPPLVVRVGPYWRLNRHVRPESGWFGEFISDHWNEALNPNRFADPYIARSVASEMRKRSANIVTFYTTIDNRPDDAVYYDFLAEKLKTYYGEPYGHRGGHDELLTIGNTCIPELERRTAERDRAATRTGVFP